MPMVDLPLGAELVLEHTVTEADTAIAYGSGDLPVLATPCLVALLENASLQLLKKGLATPDATSVGGYVALHHLKPSPLKACVRVVARIVEIDGSKCTFKLAAYQEDTLLAEGEHVRYVVLRERFMARLASSNS